ncbi:MAG: SUMF1/EgtB/PvdO family nonheme iron enzyme [Caldilineaceae bacterium]
MRGPNYYLLFIALLPLLMLGGLLFCLSPNQTIVYAQGATDNLANDDLIVIGHLYFADNESTPVGDFTLDLTNIPPAPANRHYALWLHSEQTATLALGSFTAVDGKVSFHGSTDRNLFAYYDSALISLEANDAPTRTLSGQVVFTATLPEQLFTALAPLLIKSDFGPQGLLVAAHGQGQIAVQHTGFLRNALDTTDLPEARRHSEHIVNILDGESGLVYTDLDRDGLIQNPGDGVGVRVYLEESSKAMAGLADALAGTDVATTTLNAIPPALAGLKESQQFISASFDQAFKILSADTVTEANTFAGELVTLVANIDSHITEAYSVTLQSAAYTFYGPELLLVATPTPTPSNTPTPAPTRTPTRTPSATATVTPTAVVSPTVTAIPTLARPAPTAPTPVLAESPVEVSPANLWRNPADGALYVRVDGGEFAMGARSEDSASPREEPRHVTTVNEFWLQQSEVTNAQYGRCVAAGVCTPPANKRWDQSDFADHPVADIDWRQANTYAQWVGGRLPTEAEWEKACRGTDERAYPWGNQAPDATLSNYNNSVGDTTPVGSYPAGASPYGALDMSGNVWEWTSSLDADYPYNATDGREDPTAAGKRVVRGGSFYYTQYQIRCAARTGFAPETASQHIGLRVVIDQRVTQWRHAADGALYVRVDGGEFAMGARSEDSASPREEPRHVTTVNEFWLQQSEVTNAQYGRCVAAGVCTPPANKRWDQSDFADHPVADIDWRQANTYAQWVGGRLPTEAEWEKACRGTDERAYPWGNQAPDATLSNYNNSVGDTTPVGSYPAGASPYGALDMSGNVWEWTSSLDADYPYNATDGREDPTAAGKRVVRGGSFYYTQYQIRCAARTGFAPETASQHIGLRVVLALPTGEAVKSQ